MDRDRRVRIYDLHAWTGIALGLFLFVVSFTGCLALFAEELKGWEDPAARLALPAERQPVHTTLAQWVADEAGGAEVEFLRLIYPSAIHPYYAALAVIHGEEGGDRVLQQRWNAATGAALPKRGGGLSEWLLDFHRDLMWPEWLGGRTAGSSIVGIAGIIMLLSIVSGLVTHRKMLREFYTLRLHRSARLRWKDSHNVLALWGLPFYAMISFTGAFLGIIALLLPLTGALIAKGDTDKLFAVLGGEQLEPSGVAAAMLSLDEVYHWRHPDNVHPPLSVAVTHWGDETARYELNYPADSELLIVEAATFSGVTGEPLPNDAFLAETPVNRTLAALSPLHYGTFGGITGSRGGIALKLLYFLLGLSLCALIALGLMIWLERRLHGVVGTRSEGFYRRIQQTVIGITLGNMVASVSIFYLDKGYSGAEQARITWTGITYFLAWCAVLAYAHLEHNACRSVRRLTALLGVALLSLPLLNALTTREPLFLLRAPDGSAYWVDVGLAVLGLLTCLSVPLLPKARRPDAHALRVAAARAEA